MDKLQPTGQHLGRVFNSSSGRIHIMHFHCFEVKLSNLKLKTNLRFSPVKASLLFGENRAKLVGFKNRKKYFAFFNPPNLGQISIWCKHGFRY
jgi:hypothetical protein